MRNSLFFPAFDRHSTEDSPNTYTYENVLPYRLANKLYLKVADLAAIAGDYYKSIEHYEKVAKASVASNLMKWSVKDYFLKAGICHLAANVGPILLPRHCVTPSSSPNTSPHNSPKHHILNSIRLPLYIVNLGNIGHRIHRPSARKLSRPRHNIRLDARAPAASRSSGSSGEGRPRAIRRQAVPI